MEHTPKNFVLQLGALATLYASLASIIMLLFSVITIVYPDAAAGYYEYDSSQASARYAIAMLVVFFPAYLAMTRMVNQVRRTESPLYYTLTKWIVYLSLLIGGLIILGDFVAVLNAFLNGELTLRFFLKAATLFVIVGAACWYYLLDARTYWSTHERESLIAGAMALAVVLVSLGIGFTQIDSPSVVRARSLDDRQITDLSSIQSNIENYYWQHSALPASLPVVFTDFEAPRAPEARAEYEYRVTGERSYELCATFETDTPESERMTSYPIASPEYDPNNYDWKHATGRVCFERTAPVIAADAKPGL